MNSHFIELYGDCYAFDLHSDDVLKVVSFILKLNHPSEYRRVWIKQFLLDCVTVKAIALKKGE